MTYTVQDDDAIRARIDRDLDHITRTVTAGDPRLQALVLTGGFARGEGTVLDGEPQNDYDLIAVRRLGKSWPYPRMAQALATELDIAIDLHPVWIRRLPFVGASIFWYETALRGRVLAGDAGILGRIRVRAASQLAAGEAMRLLANRAAGLLVACAPDDNAMRIQACKALLGALDAQLFILGRFPPTHVERWSIFQELRRSGRVPLALRGREDALGWAFRFKTTPSDAPFRDAAVAWHDAAAAVLAGVPGALHHAGFADLAAYARGDSWGERLHAWMHRRAGDAWRAHPSSHVRVLTIETLRAALHPAMPRSPMVIGVAELRRLRRATLQ